MSDTLRDILKQIGTRLSPEDLAALALVVEMAEQSGMLVIPLNKYGCFTVCPPAAQASMAQRMGWKRMTHCHRN